MHNLPPSTLLHSRQGRHWRIDVHRPQGVSDPLEFTVFLTGEVAADFHRSRFMELSVFRLFTSCLLHMVAELPELVATAMLEGVPTYPKARCIAMIEKSVFRIKLVLSRRRDGSLETVIATYDTDDDRAPMLLATDAEIGELCRDCVDALAAVGVTLD